MTYPHPDSDHDLDPEVCPECGGISRCALWCEGPEPEDPEDEFPGDEI